MKRESALEKMLRQAVRSAGGLCIKLPAHLYRGIPDRLVLLPGGRVYFIELKTEKGKPSVHQLRYQIFLRKLGFNSDIIQGESQLRDFIENHVERKDSPTPSGD